MSYTTKNEIANFDFSQASCVKINNKKEHVVIELEDVIILERNSCNENIKNMGTNELTLELTGVTGFRAIQDGYIIRDMNGKIREQHEDKPLNVFESDKLIKAVEGYAVAGIEKEGEVYKIFIDTDDELVSYTLLIEAKGDIESWERFRNIPSGM